MRQKTMPYIGKINAFWKARKEGATYDNRRDLFPKSVNRVIEAMIY